MGRRESKEEFNDKPINLSKVKSEGGVRFKKLDAFYNALFSYYWMEDSVESEEFFLFKRKNINGIKF